MATLREKNDELQDEVRRLEQRVKELESGFDADKKKKLDEWEEIGQKFIDIQDYSDLCDDGKELYERANALLGNDREVNNIHRLIIDLDNYCLPPGANPTDTSEYRITIRNKNGEILKDLDGDEMGEDMIPDRVVEDPD